MSDYPDSDEDRSTPMLSPIDSKLLKNANEIWWALSNSVTFYAKKEQE